MQNIEVGAVKKAKNYKTTTIIINNNNNNNNNVFEVPISKNIQRHY